MSMTRAEAEAKWGPKLPDAVKAQGEAAVATQGQLAEGRIIAEAVPVAETIKPPLTVVQPPPAVMPPFQPPPATPPVQQVTGEDWQAKYNVLQGKYNAEIPALQAAVQKANRTIEHLNGILESLTKAGPTPAPAPAAPVVNHPPAQPSQEIPATPLNLDDFEGYGDEVIALARMTAENNQLLRDLKSQYGETAKKVTEDAEDRFYDALDAAMPPQDHGQPPLWEILNKDPGFLTWLQGLDDLSGEKRHHLLTKHFNALNAQKVLVFFRTYLQLIGNQPAPTAPNRATVEPVTIPNFTVPAVIEPFVPMASPPNAPANPLASMVTVVPRDGGPPSPTPGQAQVVTREQFNKAVRDYTAHRIDEGEYAKIAQAFQQSIKQGLVR